MNMIYDIELSLAMNYDIEIFNNIKYNLIIKLISNIVTLLTNK